MAECLFLPETEKNMMYDLSVEGKKTSVSPDLTEYIMEHDNVRKALRLARDITVTEDTWAKIIHHILQEKLNRKGHNG